MNGITKQTFQAADEKTRLDILFDLLENTYIDIQKIKVSLQKHPTNCEERFKKIEKGRANDTAVSAGSGFVGGFVAIVAKFLVFGK